MTSHMAIARVYKALQELDGVAFDYEIATVTGLSVDIVQRALDELEQEQWVSRVST
jgi:predicted transcriptional regulator